MGLGEAPSNRTPQTKLMTVAWYLVGGLAAAGAARATPQAQKNRLSVPSNAADNATTQADVLPLPPSW